MIVQSKNVFVAFMDILGFGSYIEKNGTMQATSVALRASLHSMINLGIVSSERLNREKSEGERKESPAEIITLPDGSQVAIPNTKIFNINSVHIFDSIVLWTESDAAKDLEDLIDVVRGMLYSNFIDGFPLRGAIAHGELYYRSEPMISKVVTNHPILVSPAQVKAYKLESKQQWSGCVLDESVVSRCKEINMELGFKAPLYADQYDVPLKSGIKKMPIVTWDGTNRDSNVINYKNESEMYAYVAGKFSLHGKDISDGSVKEKIKNTATYMSYIENKRNDCY